MPTTLAMSTPAVPTTAAVSTAPVIGLCLGGIDHRQRQCSRGSNEQLRSDGSEVILAVHEHGIA
jgi:hypothetical protein